MDALEALLTRRSVREFKSQAVPEDLLIKVLKAGMHAPSAGNEQLWNFVVVTDRSLLDKVPAIHPNAKMVLEAPLAVLVCADLNLQKYPNYWIQDCCAAIENMLVAAHALGLGAVWTGIYPLEDRVAGMRTLFSLPEHVVPVAFIPMGYPALPPTPTDRFKEERIHRNRW